MQRIECFWDDVHLYVFELMHLDGDMQGNQLLPQQVQLFRTAGPFLSPFLLLSSYLPSSLPPRQWKTLLMQHIAAE